MEVNTLAARPARLDSIRMVKEFHQKFNHPIQDRPCLPPDRTALRISLIQEELDELKAACETGNVRDAFDALLDIQYVLAGAVLEFGMQEVFNEGFAEVHRSNLSKACQTVEDAQATILHYDGLGQPAEAFLQPDGTYHIFRSADGKLLKSIRYNPAFLEQFLT